MPRKARFKTWNLVFLTEEALDSPDVSAVVNSTRRPELRNGMCFGLCAKWCRRLLNRPDETPLDRITHLFDNLASAAATQFLQLETPPVAPSEHFDALCRVSRLKFRLALMAQKPHEAGGAARLCAAVKSDSLYCLHLHQLPSELGGSGGSDHHAVILAARSEKSSMLFDSRFGEFEIDQNRMEQFFHDYWKFQEDNGRCYDLVVGYSVEEVPEGWPQQQVVNAAQPSCVPSSGPHRVSW